MWCSHRALPSCLPGRRSSRRQAGGRSRLPRPRSSVLLAHTYSQPDTPSPHGSMDSPSFCTQATGSPPAAQLPCSPAGPPSPGMPHTQGWSSSLAACFTPRSQPPTKWYVLISKPSHTCPESPEQGSAVPVVRPLHEGSRWAPDSGRACAPAPNPAASQPHSLGPGPNISELHLTVWKSNNSPSHILRILCITKGS